MIEFEKEIVDFLGLPSIPKKEWDGYTPFDKGVAVVKMRDEREAYAVCSFLPERGDKEVVITKVFGIEPFYGVSNVFVVPNYMANVDDIQDMDLDEESKKKAEILLNEATEYENENTIDAEINLPTNEYYFENIHNDEEARAFIKAYNKKNKIKGRIPKSHEGLSMRLSVIFSTVNNK